MKKIEKVLFCSNMSDYGQIFEELLSDDGFNVRICGCNAEDALNSFHRDTPDCVIVDEEINGLGYIDFIRQINDFNTETLVVILSLKYSDRLKMKINLLDNALYLLKPADALTILTLLRKFEYICSGRFNAAMFFTDKEFEKLLCDLGLIRTLKGFDYLKECVYAVLDNPELLGNISGMLYPYVGEKISVAAANLEKNIRAAVSAAYKDGKNTILENFVGEKKCPTNGMLIKALYDYLAIPTE